MAMDSYLMMLYVTLEQESALKKFFIEHGWTFSKPDLSVTTDKLGPSVATPIVPKAGSADEQASNADQNKESSVIDIEVPTTADTPLSKHKGKRKTELPQHTQANVKQPKLSVSHSSSTMPPSSENNDTKEEEPVVGNSHTSKVGSSPITVLGEDGKHFVIKVERDSGEVQHSDDRADIGSDRNVDNTFNDDDGDNLYGDDDNDESMNMDYSNLKPEFSQGDTDPNPDSSQSSAGGSKEKMNGNYQCTTCGKKFKYDSSLSRHMRIHAGERNHPCSVCGKRFYFKYQVDNHMTVHTHDKPHICSRCGVRFAHSQTLLRHQMTHDNRMYKCDQCHKQFTRKDKLGRHQLTHKGKSKCSRCSKEVFHIEEHIKICGEGRERKHVCEVCGRKFLEKRYLQDHSRCVHSFQTLSACKKCGQQFRHRGSLSRHTRLCQN